MAWISNGTHIPAWQRVATDLKVEDQFPPLLPEDATLADGVVCARIQRTPECGENASTQTLSLWFILVQAVLTIALEVTPAIPTSQVDAAWLRPTAKVGAKAATQTSIASAWPSTRARGAYSPSSRDGR